jgi:hypothetical protein
LNGEAAVTGWVDDELAVRIDLVPVGEQSQAVPQDHVEPIAHVGGGSRGYDRDVTGHGDAFPFFAVEPRDYGPGLASALHCYTCFARFIGLDVVTVPTAWSLDDVVCPLRPNVVAAAAAVLLERM